MKLHIFNPEHDLVLACNSKSYTPSEGIRKMRSSLSYIPVFWADKGDVIATDNEETAISACSAAGICGADVIFTTTDKIRSYSFDEIVPWGWDKAVKHSLIRCGVDASLLPTDREIDEIRSMSHRKNVIPLMNMLRKELGSCTCGECRECMSLEEIYEAAAEWKRIVIKAPWSSSGINIIYVENGFDEKLSARCSRLIEKQGSLLAEPLYNKVKDFAMEFFSDGRGNIQYLGLSLFETTGTAYLNNIEASEGDKKEILCQYTSSEIADKIKDLICTGMPEYYRSRYRGPFGIDMMIVKEGDRFVIDPCVEINLRMTMGHASIFKWEYFRKHGIGK